MPAGSRRGQLLDHFWPKDTAVAPPQKHPALPSRCELQWLDELLPEDAAERCRGRVRLVVTEVPSLRLRYLEDFESKEDLIDACSELVTGRCWWSCLDWGCAGPQHSAPLPHCLLHASCPPAQRGGPVHAEPPPNLQRSAVTTVHIPFFLDGNASRTYRGQPYIDGRWGQEGLPLPVLWGRLRALATSPCPASLLGAGVCQLQRPVPSALTCCRPRILVLQPLGLPAVRQLGADQVQRRGVRGGLRECRWLCAAHAHLLVCSANTHSQQMRLPTAPTPTVASFPCWCPTQPTQPNPPHPPSLPPPPPCSSTTTSSSGAASTSSSWPTWSRCRRLCRRAPTTRSAPTPPVSVYPCRHRDWLVGV